MGRGSFGEVYEVCSQVGNKQYAMKIEWRRHKQACLLRMEQRVLSQLENVGAKHTCHSVEFGRTDTFNYIIMNKVTLTTPALFQH